MHFRFVVAEKGISNITPYLKETVPSKMKNGGAAYRANQPVPIAASRTLF